MCPQLAKTGRGGQRLRLFVNKILQRKYLQEQKIQILHEFTDWALLRLTQDPSRQSEQLHNWLIP